MKVSVNLCNLICSHRGNNVLRSENKTRKCLLTSLLQKQNNMSLNFMMKRLKSEKF